MHGRGKSTPLARKPGPAGGHGSASDAKFRVRRGKLPCGHESLYLLQANLLFAIQYPFLLAEVL